MKKLNEKNNKNKWRFLVEFRSETRHFLLLYTTTTTLSPHLYTKAT